MFKEKILTFNDLTVLFGVNTIGQAECQFFKDRIYNESNIDPNFATLRKTNFPSFGGDKAMKNQKEK